VLACLLPKKCRPGMAALWDVKRVTFVLPVSRVTLFHRQQG
jgi:hypothetical protein